MTIGTTSAFITVQGNGATTSFAYPFLIPAASDAVVTYTNPTGVQETLQTTQYTITGLGSPTGGTVTYPLAGSPIPMGSTLTIQRILPFIQSTSISNQGPTFAAIESEFDYLTMLCQQLNDANIEPISGPASYVNARGTGSFFSNSTPPATINWVGDRLFGGALTIYNGEYPVPTSEYTWADNAWGFATCGSSTWAVVNNNSVQAFTAASEASNTISPGAQGAIAIQGLSYNPAATQAVSAWSGYFEARRLTGTANTAFGIEVDPVNLGNNVVTNPIFANNGFSFGVWIASGATVGTAPSTAALGIANNGQTHNTGIVFGFNALSGTTGTSGFGQAMFMGPYQGLAWSNLSGAETSLLFSSTTTVGDAQALIFTDNGTQISQVSGATGACFTVASVPTAANGLQIVAGTTGQYVQIKALGTDANVGLTLAVQGSAAILCGANFIPGADNAVSLGQSGSRYTAVWAVNGTIQTSDPRLKTDIADLPSMMAILESINPKTFKWIDGGPRRVEREIEVEEHVHDVVVKDVENIEHHPDGTHRLVKNQVEHREPAYTTVPLHDANGQPIIDRVLKTRCRNARGGFDEVWEDRPRMHAVPVMRKVRKTVVDLVSRPGERTHCGFLAPEVKAAFDAMNMDFGGYVKAEDGTEALRPDQLIAVLWRITQEMAAKIRALEERP